MRNFVRKEVDKQIDAIQDKKQENYEKIVGMYFREDKPRKERKTRWILVPALASLLVVVIGGIFLFNSLYKPALPEYFSDKEIAVDATVEEIEQTSAVFNFNFEGLELNKNKRIYDSVSGDMLRFETQIVEDEFTIDLIYITNRFYEFQSELSMLDKVKDYQGVEAKYYYQYSSFQATVTAYLEKDGERIFLTYKERTATDSEDSFWAFMNEFITVV